MMISQVTRLKAAIRVIIIIIIGVIGNGFGWGVAAGRGGVDTGGAAASVRKLKTDDHSLFIGSKAITCQK